MDKKALSLPILTSLVVGNMIGTGIYLLPASLAEYGTASLFAWLFTSLGALFLALTFAHLNKRYPKTGGPIIFCREAYGRVIGFIVAYIYWLSNMASIAGLAVSSIGYIGFLTPTLNANVPEYSPYLALCLQIGTVWLFCLINIIGIHAAGVVQLVLTIIKILPLIIISGIGLFHVHTSNLTQVTIGHQSDFFAISSAAALTFWSFIGLESATVPAENTRGPRDIYKATVYGTLLTACIYIVSTFVLMGMIPVEQLKNSQFPFAQAGTMLFGSIAATLVTICAVISGMGSLNGCTLLQGQIVFSSAREHYFPRLFTKLTKHDAPYAGQILSSVIVSLFLFMTVSQTLLKQFNRIALLAALLTLIMYLITTLAEIKFLLRDDRPLYQIFKSTSVYITLIALAYSSWMISSFDKVTLNIAILIFIIGVPIYFLSAHQRIKKSA